MKLLSTQLLQCWSGGQMNTKNGHLNMKTITLLAAILTGCISELPVAPHVPGDDAPKARCTEGVAQFTTYSTRDFIFYGTPYLCEEQ